MAGKRLVIINAQDRYDGLESGFRLFELSKGAGTFDEGVAALVATASNPGELSEFAFNTGALSVRHEYDLVAEHARFHRG